MSESRDRATSLDVRPARPEDLEEIVKLQLQLRNHHRRLEPENPGYLITDHEWRSLIECDLNEADGGRSFYGRMGYEEISVRYGKTL